MSGARKAYSLQQKVDAIDLAKRLNNVSAAADQRGVLRTALTAWMKKEKKIREEL